MDVLLNPPFAANPAFRANGKIVGIVIAILAAIGLILTLLAIPAVFVVVGSLVGVATLIDIVGQALSLWGGYQMFRGNADGKRWVIYGLILGAISSLLRLLAGDLGLIISFVIIAAVYYVVVTSRVTPEPA